jgi:alkylmercury lyase
MTSRLIDELPHKLAPALDDPRCSAGELLFPAILPLVATGKPVVKDELGRKLDMHPHFVNETIAFLYPDTEFDSEGRLVGLGLSQRPTPHRVQFKRRQEILYAWCALDALLLPILLGEGARVTSTCPGSGQQVSVLLGSNGVEEVNPATAVVSFVTELNFASPRASGCELQHFFISDDAAAGWVEERPEAVVVPVGDAFQVLHRLSQRSVDARTRGSVDLGEVMALLVPLFVGNETETIQCRLIEKRGNQFMTDTGQPSTGDMWWDADLAGWLDSELHRGRGGGPHLVVRLPNEWEWDMDGPMSNGPGWHRSGEPPAVTAMPSIIAGDYHGMLVQGKLIRIG